jgi:hypothetical protein
MKRKILTTTLLVCCFVAAFAFIADLTGSWSGAVKGPDGNDYPLSYVFKVDGDKLTGTAKTTFGETPIEKGKVTGNDFTFSTTLNGMEVPHTGKFMTDSISLSIDYDGNKLFTVLKRDQAK